MGYQRPLRTVRSEQHDDVKYNRATSPIYTNAMEWLSVHVNDGKSLSSMAGSVQSSSGFPNITNTICDKTKLSVSLTTVRKHLTSTELWHCLGSGKARSEFIEKWTFGAV